nr:hypothetical protein [Tanacetum cinerariifolium]
MAKPILPANARRVSPKAKNHNTPEGQRGWRTGVELRKEPKGRNPKPDEEGPNIKKQFRTLNTRKGESPYFLRLVRCGLRDMIKLEIEMDQEMCEETWEFKKPDIIGRSFWKIIPPGKGHPPEQSEKWKSREEWRKDHKHDE